MIGQSLAAAAKSVRADMQLHSMHSYFLQKGSMDDAIIYNVRALRDGTSYATRLVTGAASATFRLRLPPVPPPSRMWLPPVPPPRRMRVPSDAGVQRGKSIFVLTASFAVLSRPAPPRPAPPRPAPPRHAEPRPAPPPPTSTLVNETRAVRASSSMTDTQQQCVITSLRPMHRNVAAWQMPESSKLDRQALMPMVPSPDEYVRLVRHSPARAVRKGGARTQSVAPLLQTADREGEVGVCGEAPAVSGTVEGNGAQPRGAGGHPHAPPHFTRAQWLGLEVSNRRSTVSTRLALRTGALKTTNGCTAASWTYTAGDQCRAAQGVSAARVGTARQGSIDVACRELPRRFPLGERPCRIRRSTSVASCRYRSSMKRLRSCLAMRKAAPSSLASPRLGRAHARMLLPRTHTIRLVREWGKRGYVLFDTGRTSTHHIRHGLTGVASTQRRRRER
jgi:hypothetical protein